MLPYLPKFDNAILFLEDVGEAIYRPGIDFAGEVVGSSDKRYKQGDLVTLTGWRVGEIWWGGYAQFAKVRADWPLFIGLFCCFVNFIVFAFTL